MASLIPVILIVALLVFMGYSMRRQMRGAQNVRSAQASLEPGVDVMTTAGLYGKVVAVGDSTVDLEVSTDVVVRFTRAAIRDVLPTSEQTGDDALPDVEDASPSVPELPTVAATGEPDTSGITGTGPDLRKHR